MTEEAYTLDGVHDEIQSIYLWWAIQSPGTTPLESGHLGDLWSLADRLTYEEENNNG